MEEKKTFSIYPQFISSANQRHLAGIFLVLFSANMHILQAPWLAFPHTHSHIHRYTQTHTLWGCHSAWVVCCSLGDSAICCLASQGGQSLPLYCCPDSKERPLQYNTCKTPKTQPFSAFYFFLFTFQLANIQIWDRSACAQWDVEWMFVLKAKINIYKYSFLKV